MIRVVLVDDQAVVRAGFRVLLEEHGDIAVVGEAAGGREAVAVVARERPDVVCMDLRMPAGDGLTATRQIVASRQDGSPAVLVVTTFDLDADVFGALEAGADGFILKDCEPEELVDAVRRLAAGYGLVDHTVTRRVIAEFARRKHDRDPETDGPGTGDRETPRHGHVERGDRDRTRGRDQHREIPPDPDPAQDRRQGPGAGGGVGPPQWPRRMTHMP